MRRRATPSEAQGLKLTLPRSRLSGQLLPPPGQENCSSKPSSCAGSMVGTGMPPVNAVHGKLTVPDAGSVATVAVGCWHSVNLLASTL